MPRVPDGSPGTRLRAALGRAATHRRVRALVCVCYFPALLAAGLAAPPLAAEALEVGLRAAIQWATVATMVGYLAGVAALR